ncbi:hypothetical protein NUW58_g5242 [Xylaria curta]|uniref:Uncharacterized protein n=1 Tax=Xylaria curta TaxID=42375 RepID=A0ACC1P317_9PEZI|nr:hypothetical protein NUW58_g5242 [Xylaria curta]
MQSLGKEAQNKARVYKLMKDPAMPKGRWNHDDQRHMCGAYRDNRVVPYEGVVVSSLSAEQQDLVVQILEQYLLYLSAQARAMRLDDAKALFDETYFCWIGGHGDDDAFYYRVQSPVVIAEFDHHSGVFLTNSEPAKFHIHTLLRTPNAGDYGWALRNQIEGVDQDYVHLQRGHPPKHANENHLHHQSPELKMGDLLLDAVRSNDLPSVQSLISQGVDINEDDGHALFFAAQNENLEIIKFLVDNGARVNNSSWGSKAFYSAILSGNLEIVKVLVDNGANPSQQTGYHGSPLHVAAAKQNPEIVKVLLDEGVNVNSLDAAQQTALHRAVKHSSVPIVRLLLAHRASLSAKDDIGRTPFDIAIETRNREMIELLLPEMETPPSLSGKDWLPAPNPPRVYPIPLDVEAWWMTTADNGPMALLDPLYQIHDICNGRLLQGLSRSASSSRWWRKNYWVSSALLRPDEPERWHLERSKLPSHDLLGRLSHDEFFVESWFVLPCPTITTGNWPKPQVPMVENYDDIEQHEGFVWAMILQSPIDVTHDVPAGRTWRIFRSWTTVDHAPVERVRSVEGLVIPLIDKLDQIFKENNAQASHQLSRSRLDVLRNGGANPRLLQRLLSDATVIEHLAESHTNIVRSLAHLLESIESLQWWSLQDSREKLKDLMTRREELRVLLDKSQSIIQLEFNLTSILEAQRSTTTNRSLKRLTWVTFAYLPLLFVASLFGMNVDILKDNPSWWWYFPIAGGFTLLTFTVWIVFKRFHAAYGKQLEGKLEKSFTWLVGEELEAKVSPLLPVNMAIPQQSTDDPNSSDSTSVPIPASPTGKTSKEQVLVSDNFAERLRFLGPGSDHILDIPGFPRFMGFSPEQALEGKYEILYNGFKTLSLRNQNDFEEWNNHLRKELGDPNTNSALRDYYE